MCSWICEAFTIGELLCRCDIIFNDQQERGFPCAQLLEPDLVQRNTAPAKKARGLAEPNKGTRARPAVRGAGILQGVVTTSVRWPRADAEGPQRFRVRAGATVAAFDVKRFDGGGGPE